MSMTGPQGGRRRDLLGHAAIVALLGLPGLAGCNQPHVDMVQGYQGGRLPPPDRILVHDFAVRPQDVRLDSGLRGRLTQVFSRESTSELQYQAARETSAALSEALVAGLRRYGLPVERTSHPGAPGPGRFLLVDGQLLAVDEGNRTQRVMIGLGRGRSSVEAGAQVYYLDRSAPPRLIETFEARTDSGRAPGMAETMGIGAVAGRLGASAAAGAGAHAAIEGSRADDIAEARRLGEALAQRVGQFLVRQGWVAPPR